MRQEYNRRQIGVLRMATPFFFMLLGLVALSSSTVWASPRRRTPVVEAVEAARPSVVNIQGRKVVRSDQVDGSGDPFRQVNGMGTGIIIDQRGYILTNHHVVENVELIQVTLADRRGFVARLISHDPVTDLAVIKIDGEGPLPVIRVGISSDLMPGEPVIAVGNAFGYEHTVTRGIISALHREVQVSATQKYSDLIQTDASINPGNSGGPLLNIDGDMIGINVAVRVGAQGIGFAIPVDDVMDIAAGLLSVERIDNVTHGVLGETAHEDTERFFVVRSIRGNSAAADSDLRPGDRVVAVDETPIQRAVDFERALLGSEPGKPVSLTIRRHGQEQVVSLLLQGKTRDASDFDGRAWKILGVKLEPVPQAQWKQLSTRYRGGLRVVAVRAEGPAAQQGIQLDDVLVGMHVWETVSTDNVVYILNHADFQKFQPIKFYVARGKDILYGHMDVRQPPVVQVSRRMRSGD